MTASRSLSIAKAVAAYAEDSLSTRVSACQRLTTSPGP